MAAVVRPANSAHAWAIPGPALRPLVGALGAAHMPCYGPVFSGGAQFAASLSSRALVMPSGLTLCQSAALHLRARSSGVSRATQLTPSPRSFIRGSRVCRACGLAPSCRSLWFWLILHTSSPIRLPGPSSAGRECARPMGAPSGRTPLPLTKYARGPHSRTRLSRARPICLGPPAYLPCMTHHDHANFATRLRPPPLLGCLG